MLPTRKPKDKYRYPQDPRSRIYSKDLPEGEYVFVQDEQGAVWVLPNGPHYHPRILGNATPVAAAGEMVVGHVGEIIEINNLSGTFEFGPEVLQEVVDYLKAQGAIVLDDAIHEYYWE